MNATTNSNIGTLISLYSAIICASNLRKEVEDSNVAAKKAWSDSEEAVQARQAFAAMACGQEEELAESLLLEVGAAELETYAQSVVEAKGLALDRLFAKIDACTTGYHRLNITVPSCVKEEDEAGYRKLEEDYDRALVNQEAVKAFLANR
jgi:hypothetical protein